ncbi:MAG: methyltransferase domain-containing protein [Xanthobacteraceae bacterium]|nr:methyltransferase domain-containing protein [Xanthobacteraceae bacterium]MCW5674532.1 methyltransferase domain-containing protein [Xanthobacteraceae bacterium]
MSEHQSEILEQHYAGGDIVAGVKKALGDIGKAEGALKPEELSSIDQFHVRSLLATKDLAAAAEPQRDMEILDIGSGLGGAARYLASAFGCRVTGIDLMQSYCDAAAMLTERCNLSDRISFRQADALALPFPDARFDQVWTQHVSMNIADKATLYSEMHRVLRANGRLAIYDPVRAGSEPLHYPVPWARDERTSFVPTEAELKQHLQNAGFTVRSWEDKTQVALQWFEEMEKKWAGTKPSPLGIHVLIGPDIRPMSTNLRTNLREGRAKLIQAVCEAR